MLRVKGVTYRSAYRKMMFALLVVAGSLIGVGYGISGVAIGALAALLITTSNMISLTLRVLEGNYRDFFQQLMLGWLMGGIVVFFTCSLKSALDPVYVSDFSKIILLLFANIIIVFLVARFFPESMKARYSWLTQAIKQKLYTHISVIKRRFIS